MALALGEYFSHYTARDFFVLQMIGLAKGAFENATAYVHQREAFGQKIADFQAMQHLRAQLATEIEAGSLMVYNAARMKDHGQDFVKEAAMAKYYCSEVNTVLGIAESLHQEAKF